MESNHSITLCPRLSRLLPKHPNAPPRSSHQSPGLGLQPSSALHNTEGDCASQTMEKNSDSPTCQRSQKLPSKISHNHNTKKLR